LSTYGSVDDGSGGESAAAGSGPFQYSGSDWGVSNAAAAAAGGDVGAATASLSQRANFSSDDQLVSPLSVHTVRVAIAFFHFPSRAWCRR
jgi:hypothetical protein